jgi:hypothetical protein
VDLSANKLSGTLPLQWSMLVLLQQLNLADNFLVSTLPLSWGVGLTSLNRLIVSNNVGL